MDPDDSEAGQLHWLLQTMQLIMGIGAMKVLESSCRNLPAWNDAIVSI
jgi:hypothetical protein